ncbi:glycine-rich SFCGS family protein [Xenorhabdus lircayensis]|uniref:Glycine-rich SFCGS family protein n=1 Tax=Xenorhabdus lircayensis TaxID=2763499 RepID=A0ABS0U1K7_9GAMM|nr:glycine-rich SFCGS family protein [Xenorhabdus lircayensis]MBI6547760.1 glycine-rich SFCGS family protein [Xenorhabdus lircayensis]
MSKKTFFKEQVIKTPVVKKQVVVVIGDRLGKGQNVAVGIEAAGGKAIVIPGMAADMKLGDVMHQEQADIGISFCGSGGAGAITAQNKYGYSVRHGMRSIEEGETAIREGCTVLGFGFMDKAVLGERLVQAFIKKQEKQS